jgi:hypothetical protein
MPLKSVLENLDNVDEALKAHYKETDGQFILQVEGVREHPEVTALRNAYQRTKDDLELVKAELKSEQSKSTDLPDDFDLKKWNALKDGDDDAAKIKLREDMEAKIAAAEKRADDAEGKLLSVTRERDLGDELAKAGVTDPTFARAARSMIAGQIKLDDDGNSFVETDMGPKKLSEYVPLWAAGEGKPFVTPAKGSDAKGGDGVTKGKKFSEMTGTEKVALNRDNPAEYERLKAEAA